MTPVRLCETVNKVVLVIYLCFISLSVEYPHVGGLVDAEFVAETENIRNDGKRYSAVN